MGPGTTAAQFPESILCGSHFTKIAQIAATSRGVAQKSRSFLCRADCVAEREGFEPPVRFRRKSSNLPGIRTGHLVLCETETRTRNT